MFRKLVHIVAVCFPAFVLRSISDDKKVDYPGGEV